MTATIQAKTLGSMLLVLTTLMTTIPAKAQTAPHTQITLSQQGQNYTVLHVDAATGHDQRGAGSVEQPYQTITQALQVAPVTSTVILLAPGHYSSSSGEQFPLRLRPGITIQGNVGATRNTIIVGSGEFRDGPTTQNTAIVTSDRSGLANLTVSNPKGSGVWISEGAPILRRVALMANAVAGVQVTAGAPLIENSYFHQNPNGLAIQGNSRATIRENLFEATGRAITVASPATPTINNNRIARNDVGIALKNNARPVLTANILNGNERNGVVEVEPTTAELPVGLPTTSESSDTDLLAVRTPEEPREVAELPAVSATAISETAATETITSGQEVPAVLTRSESVAEVAVKLPTAIANQTTDTVPVAATNVSIAPVEAETAETFETTEITETADTNETALDEGEDGTIDGTMSEIAAFRQHLVSASVPASAANETPPPILQRASLSRSTATDNDANDEVIQPDFAESLSTEGGIPIAVISVDEAELTVDEDEIESTLEREVQSHESGREGVSKLLARLQQPVAAVATSAGTNTTNTAPPANNITPPADVMAVSGQRLPVPSAAIPSGGGSGNLTPPGTVALASTFRYRVLVDMADADDLQNLVPDAFRTQVGGRMFMQAGAYVNETEAQERLTWLQENGIESRVDLRE
ncbi:MAG: DUF1565 domain-containing protein [Cyanobacteria bacterium P01_B01_bin.77]